MAFYTELEHTSGPEVLTLEKAKEHLKIEADFQDEDLLIQGYIDAAIEVAENYINRSIREKKFFVAAKNFDDVLNFRKQKIESIEEIKYKTPQGALALLDGSFYRLAQIDKFENRVIFEFPGVEPEIKEDREAVEMRVILGFQIVPKAITQALLLMVSEMYEFRSDRPKKSGSVAMLMLSPFRYIQNEQ